MRRTWLWLAYVLFLQIQCSILMVRLRLVPLTISSLEDLGYEISLVGVMESSHGEAELIGQADESVDVNSFVTVRLNLGSFIALRFVTENCGTNLDAST